MYQCQLQTHFSKDKKTPPTLVALRTILADTMKQDLKSLNVQVFSEKS
ncbi:hypothetical protein HMPREF1554_01323 [Porphyromonas gingivalis F0569]|nr:hypothetical protein HMPREF1554_01323 [Porphyromonas gingivalis F0569]